MGKPGRKPIEIDLAQVESLAAQGLNQEQIADALGIGTRTLEARKATNPAFLAAIKKGKAKGLAIVTNKLFEACKGGAAWAICFYLKCRGGKDWREKDSDSAVEPNKPEVIIE